MGLSHEKQSVEDFFAGLRSMLGGYRPVVRYFALRDGDAWVLVQGRLYLDTAKATPPARSLQTTNARFGEFALAERGLSPEDFVNQLLGGSLATPDGDLIFRPRTGAGFGVACLEHDPSNPTNQNRIRLLSVVGDDRVVGLIRQPELDWELRSSSTPYDGLAEAIADYRIGGFRTDAASFEVVGFNAAVVDYSSKISGRDARPVMRLALGLDRQRASLGFRVFSRGAVVARGRVSGSEMEWADTETWQEGTAKIDIPEAAVLHCFAVYDGRAQHHGWLADPTNTQNPRRAAYQLIDPNFDTLRDLLGKTGRGSNARELETGVAWLAWMLGFSVAHLGATPRTQDAVDLIATCPAGHFAVVEVTTGTLKTDNKLPLLVQRATAIRQRLDAADSRHLLVLPVIVTSLTTAEVRADIEQAQRLGVFVVAKERLLAGLERTLVLPNADQIFSEAEQRVRAAEKMLSAADAAGDPAEPPLL